MRTEQKKSSATVVAGNEGDIALDSLVESHIQQQVRGSQVSMHHRRPPGVQEDHACRHIPQHVQPLGPRQLSLSPLVPPARFLEQLKQRAVLVVLGHNHGRVQAHGTEAHDVGMGEAAQQVDLVHQLLHLGSHLGINAILTKEQAGGEVRDGDQRGGVVKPDSKAWGQRQAAHGTEVPRLLMLSQTCSQTKQFTAAQSEQQGKLPCRTAFKPGCRYTIS